MAAANSQLPQPTVIHSSRQQSPYVYGVRPVFDFEQLEEELKLKRIALREQPAESGFGLGRVGRMVTFHWQLSTDSGRSCPLYNELGVKNFIVCKFARSLRSGDIESVLRHGMQVKVNGVRSEYCFFGHSASQLRERECVLYNKSNLGDRERIQAQFGNFQAIRQDHKRAARIGMLLSSAESKVLLTDSEIIQIDDVERNGYNFTDGCGKVSIKTAEALTKSLGVGHLYSHQEVKVPSVFQVRLKGCKGVLALDLGVEHGIQVRPSMVKFEWRQKKSHPLRIVENGYSKPNEIGRINKQFIQLLSSLGVPDEVFETKQWEHLGNVEQLLTNQEVAMLYLSAFGQSGLAEKLVSTGITGEVEHYLRKIKREIKKGRTVATPDQKPRSKAEKLQIPIEQSRLVFGICDPTDCLQYGQCFFQPTIRGHPQVLVDRHVIVGRSPSHHPGDLRVLACVDVPGCHHLVDCIVFPVHGNRPHADEMSGGDLDGDKFFVCWDQELIPPRTEPPCSYKFAPRPQRRGRRPSDPMISLFAQYDQRILGYVDRLFNEWADARGAGSVECKCLSELSSKAVDAAKTGGEVKIPSALRHPPAAATGRFIWQKMEHSAKLFVEDQLMSELGCVQVGHISVETMTDVVSDLTSTMSDYWLFRLAWKWWKATSASTEQFRHLLDFVNFSNMTLQQRRLVMVDLTPGRGTASIIPQPIVFNALYRSAVFNQEDLVYFGLDKHGSGWRHLKSVTAETLTSSLMASIFQFPQPKLLIFEFLLGDLHWGFGLFLSGYFPFDPQETVVCFQDNKECRIVTCLAIHTDEPIREIRHIPTSYSVLWENGIFQLFEDNRTKTFVFMDFGQGQPMASVALNRFSKRIMDRAPTKLRRESSGRVEVYAWTHEDEQLPFLLCPSENTSNEELEPVTAAAAVVGESDFTVMEDEFPRLGEEEEYLRKKETEIDKEIQRVTQLLSAGQLTAQSLEPLIAMMHSTTKDDATVLACHIEYFLFEGKIALGSSERYLPVLISLLHCSGLAGWQQNEPLFRLEKWANGGRVQRFLLGMQQHGLSFTMDELDYLLKYILYACNVTVAYQVLDMLHRGDVPLSCESGISTALDYYRRWVATLTVEMVEEIAGSRAQSRSTTISLFKDSDCRYDIHIQTPDFVIGTGDALLVIPLSGSVSEYYVLQVTQPDDRIVSATQVWPSGDGATSPADGEWRARCQVGTVTYNRALDALRAVLSYDLQTSLPSPVFRVVLQLASPVAEPTTETAISGRDHFVPEESAIGNSADIADIAQSESEDPVDLLSTDQMQKFDLESFTSADPVSVTLIQGPPGTGKTRTSAYIVSHWYRVSKEPILLAAETNEGVDNLIEKIIEVGTVQKDEILRLGRDEKIKDRSYAYSFESKYDARRRSRREFDPALAKKIIDKARVVCTTCIGAGVTLLKDRKFPRVLIDEACQATEPAALVPLVYGCRELVLVGDDKQLPPLVKSERASELRTSLFERLARSGVPVYLLDTQYRMHPAIAEYPSFAFYSGRLKNGVSERDRPIPRGFSWPRPGSPLAFVDVEGEERTSRSSKENETEAETVCEIVQSLLSAGDVTPEQIGIITPYRAQEARIKDGLSRIDGCSAVFVKTVDGFQGQEREVIVFSAVRSNDHGNVGFLEDKSRFNVALTRSRCGLIVVGNSKTLSGQDPDDEGRVWNRWITWMKGKEYWIEGKKKDQRTSRGGTGRPGRVRTGSGGQSGRGNAVASSFSQRGRGRPIQRRGYRGRGGGRRGQGEYH